MNRILLFDLFRGGMIRGRLFLPDGEGRTFGVVRVYTLFIVIRLSGSSCSKRFFLIESESTNPPSMAATKERRDLRPSDLEFKRSGPRPP